MTHTNRFDGKSEIYAKARPKYAAELFECLKNVLLFMRENVRCSVLIIR